MDFVFNSNDSYTNPTHSHNPIATHAHALLFAPFLLRPRLRRRHAALKLPPDPIGWG